MRVGPVATNQLIGIPVDIIFQISTSASKLRSECHSPASTPPCFIFPDIHAPFSFPMQAPLLRIPIPQLQRSISRLTSTQSKSHFKLQQISYKRQYAMAGAMHGHSAACCNIPPIISKGYEPKGKYETIGGLKTCKSYSIAPELVFYIPSNQQLRI